MHSYAKAFIRRLPDAAVLTRPTKVFGIRQGWQWCDTKSTLVHSKVRPCADARPWNEESPISEQAYYASHDGICASLLGW